MVDDSYCGPALNVLTPYLFITPQKGGLCNHLRQSVCLFVCLFVNGITQTIGSISMKFGSMTDNDVGKNPLKFGHDPDHYSHLRSERNTFSFKSIACCFKSITCWSCGR